MVGLSKIGDPSEAMIYVERDRGGIWRDIRPLEKLLSSYYFCLSVYLYICNYVLATQLDRLIWNRVEIKKSPGFGSWRQPDTVPDRQYDI